MTEISIQVSSRPELIEAEFANQMVRNAICAASSSPQRAGGVPALLIDDEFALVVCVLVELDGSAVREAWTIEGMQFEPHEYAIARDKAERGYKAANAFFGRWGKEFKPTGQN